MIKETRILALTLILAAGSAVAHSGVKNAAVAKRMHAMGIIGENTKLLGAMSKGQTAFDATADCTAAAAIADQAARIPALFPAKEDDPKSEALPPIWTSFGDFTRKAEDLQAAAMLATEIRTPTDLRVAMGNLGGACQACHTKYRE